MRPTPFKTKSSFDFTTPKKKKQLKCDELRNVFHIRNGEQDSCLEETDDKSLSLSECDKLSVEQQWKTIKIPSTDGMHICSETGCLAVVFTTKIIKSKPKIILQPFDNKIYSYHQQWIFDEKIQKVQNVATNLCLTAVVPFGSQNNSVSSTRKFKIDVDPCLEEPNDLQKWSFCGY